MVLRRFAPIPARTTVARCITAPFATTVMFATTMMFATAAAEVGNNASQRSARALAANRVVEHLQWQCSQQHDCRSEQWNVFGVMVFHNSRTKP